MISDEYKSRRDYNEYRNENPNRNEDLNYRDKTPSYGYPERERYYDRQYDRSSGYFRDQDSDRLPHEYRDYYNEESYPDEPFYGGHFNRRRDISRERNVGKGYHPQDYDYNRGNEDYERGRSENAGQQEREGYRRSHLDYERNRRYEGRSSEEYGYGVPDYKALDSSEGNFSMSGGRYGNSKNYRGDMNYTGERNYGGNTRPFGTDPRGPGKRDSRGSYYESQPDYIREDHEHHPDRYYRDRDRY